MDEAIEAIIAGPLLTEIFEADEHIASTCTDGSKVYDRLDASRREIRLLRLLDSMEHEQINCTVTGYPLDEAPSYTALSYAWGNRSTHRSISLNGGLVDVAENLWRFLQHISVLRKRLRDDRWQWFWIDALCINQQDTAERRDQVVLMAEIYSKAMEVLVWLGSAYQGSDRVMKDLVRPASHWHKKRCYVRFWKHAGAAQLAQLCQRRYWSRLWTFQELGRAKEIRLMCGFRTISWDSLESFVLSVESSNYCLPDQHERVRISVLESPATTRVKQRHTQHNQTPLFELMQYTKHFKCSEPLDKVYALLGVVDSDITPDYERPLGALLNVVLRSYHETNPPETLEVVLTQCRFLCNTTNVKLESMFHLQAGGGLIPVPDEDDLRTCPLSVGPDDTINLWWALFYGHTTIARMYFKFGDIGEKHLRHACAVQCTAAVDMLFGKVGPMDSNGQYADGTLLYEAIEMACATDQDDVALYLIRHSACNVNLGLSPGSSPCKKAVMGHRRMILEALLESPDLDADEASWCLLTAFTEEKSELIECFLSSSRWNTYRTAEYGRLLLNTAMLLGFESLAMRLIASMASDEFQTINKGRNALDWPSTFAMPSVLEALLSRGVDVNARTPRGHYALMSALFGEKDQNHEAIDLLLRYGADPNITHYGDTPLGIAIDRKDKQAVVKLLDHAANLEDTDQDRNTALHRVAASGDEEIAEILLSKVNVRMRATNKYGQTAYDIAIENGFDRLAQRLRNAPIWN